MPKVPSFEEKNYKKEDNLFDCIQQAFEDLKDELKGHHSWNVPVEKVQGITMKMVGPDKLQIMLHRYEVGTKEMIERSKENGFKVIDQVSRDLQKRTKKLFGKKFKLKQCAKDQDIEHQSQMWAESTPLYGQTFGNKLSGRFLLRDRKVYEILTDADDEE